MAATQSFTFSYGTVEKSPSKERWQPGDPLPWNANVYEGVPCTKNMTTDRLRAIKKEFVAKSDDVCIVTYPKSGTTWTIQIVKCLQTKGEPETVTTILTELYPWIESVTYDLDSIIQSPSPRVYKSHGTYSMVPKVKEGLEPCKYIHVIRHPKDVCVSLFHHMGGFKVYDYSGPFSEFFDLFYHGMVELGSWFEYEKAWWAHRHDPNVLFLKYEDMQANPGESVERIAKFMNIAVTPEIVQKTVEKSSFKKMKQDPSSNNAWTAPIRREGAEPFMRKGIVGDWRSHFSEEQSKAFDKLFHEQLDGTGLELEWDI